MIERLLNTDSTDMIEPAEPTDSTEPVEPIDRIEPADPIDRIEPTLPIDKIEPAEPIDSTERAELIGCGVLAVDPMFTFLQRCLTCTSTDDVGYAAMPGLSGTAGVGKEMPRRPGRPSIAAKARFRQRAVG